MKTILLLTSGYMVLLLILSLVVWAIKDMYNDWKNPGRDW